MCKTTDSPLSHFPHPLARSYVADSINNNIRKVVIGSAGTPPFPVDTFIGGSYSATATGFANGQIPVATFSQPTGVFFFAPPALPPTAVGLLITDSLNNLVRSVVGNPVPTAGYFAGGYYPVTALYNQQSQSLVGSNYNSLISSSGYISLWIGKA